jgi:hypothetical protein
MNSMMKTLGLTLLAAGMAAAHLANGSLKPAGGENLKPGDSFTISWTENIHHAGGTDIDFSKDNGATWTLVKHGFADAEGANSFKWTVPDMPTTTGKIRVCLAAGGNCADVKVSSPSDVPYTLVSNVFTVAAGSAIEGQASAGAASLRFDPATRNVDVSFALASDRDVRLQAFDSQGRLVATLVEGRHAAGVYRFSVYSNRLNAASGPLVFRLQAGDELLSTLGASAR